MFDWEKCVEQMTDLYCTQLATERGYRVEFCRWLRAEKLIGIYKEQFAFPVCDPEGAVVSCHLKTLAGNWQYFPNGKPTSPLVVGKLATAKTVLVFESPWDAFAFADRLGWDTDEAARARCAFIITRGAGNGKRVRGLILPPTAQVLVVMQNDPPKQDGSPGAADKWLDDVVEAVDRRVSVLRPPDAHKDLNDWTRAGATHGNITSAWVTALKSVRIPVGTAGVSEPQAQVAPENAVSTRPFPTDALGPMLARFVREVARVERVPEGLVACCALGILSGTLGKQLRGRLLPDKITPGNLYILAAARSGVGKSETARHCDGPLLSYSEERLDAWKRDVLPGLLAEKEMLQEQKRKLNRTAKAGMPAEAEYSLRDRLTTLQKKLDEIEDKLVEPRLITEDVTTQRLGMLLHVNQQQLCVLSRDAGDVVNNLLGRNHKIVATDESLYLKGFSLDPLTVDRVGRPSVQLREPCLAVLLLTQPDKLDRLLRHPSLRDGGLMPRFLSYQSEAPPQHIGLNMTPMDLVVQKEYAELLNSLLRSFRCSNTDPVFVDATPEAKGALVNYHNQVVDRRQHGPTSFEGFAARHAEQACRIALVLHAADHGPDAGNHPLDVGCASRGIEIAEWFAAEQLALLTSGTARSEAKLKEAVVALAQEAKFASSGISARDVQRARLVEQAVQAMDCLDDLVTEGRLELVPPPQKGQGGPRYRPPTE